MKQDRLKDALSVRYSETFMRITIFWRLTFMLLLCGCASLPGHVAGHSMANGSPPIVRLAFQSILAAEALDGQSGQGISVVDTQVLDRPSGYTIDSRTDTASAKWIERWTIQRPNGVVTYRVTFDACGPEGLVVSAIQEDSNGNPKIPILDLNLK